MPEVRTESAYVGPKHAGLLLGLSADRIRQLCNSGALPYRRTASGRRISLAAIRNYAQRRSI